MVLIFWRCVNSCTTISSTYIRVSGCTTECCGRKKGRAYHGVVTFERGKSTEFFICAWLVEAVKVVHCFGRNSLASFGFKFLRNLWPQHGISGANGMRTCLQAKLSWRIWTLKCKCQIYAVVVIGFAAVHNLLRCRRHCRCCGCSRCQRDLVMLSGHSLWWASCSPFALHYMVEGQWEANQSCVCSVAPWLWEMPISVAMGKVPGTRFFTRWCWNKWYSTWFNFHSSLREDW